MATTRRGRPRAGEREARRAAVLDAAFDLLVERGYQRTTMAAVAQRSGASKETLYAWFGDKPGLFAALVRRNAGDANRAVEAALGDDDVEQTLVRFATGLLSLLLGERALAINRAAITELTAAPQLAEVLRDQGRQRTGPMVEAYLALQAERGRLRIDDPARAFGLLYGLVVQDSQILALLGDLPLDRAAIELRARDAVTWFLALTAGDDPTAAYGVP
jgi:AcrR family transcriptional regulator